MSEGGAPPGPDMASMANQINQMNKIGDQPSPDSVVLGNVAGRFLLLNTTGATGDHGNVSKVGQSLSLAAAAPGALNAPSIGGSIFDQIAEILKVKTSVHDAESMTAGIQASTVEGGPASDSASAPSEGSSGGGAPIESFAGGGAASDSGGGGAPAEGGGGDNHQGRTLQIEGIPIKGETVEAPSPAGNFISNMASSFFKGRGGNSEGGRGA